MKANFMDKKYGSHIPTTHKRQQKVKRRETTNKRRITNRENRSTVHYAFHLRKKSNPGRVIALKLYSVNMCNLKKEIKAIFKTIN